jgi:glycosyltransferase involved in cell wall biosynthesis
MGRRLRPLDRVSAHPTISVVVPSFNGAEYLRSALESVLAQDPPVTEVIVQDAGSTDATAAIIEALGDDRIRFISEPDNGQSDALNRAIGRATGDWILWLNVDDIVRPGLTAAADDVDDVDVVYGDFDWIDGHDAVLRHVTPSPELSQERLLADGCYFFSGAALFRRSVFERFGLLDTGLRYTMDYDFYLRIAPHVRARYVPCTLGAFRVHGDSKTSSLTWGIFRETARVRRRHDGYRAATRTPVLVNQVKQLIDLATLPLRRRVGWE